MKAQAWLQTTRPVPMLDALESTWPIPAAERLVDGSQVGALDEQFHAMLVRADAPSSRASARCARCRRRRCTMPTRAHDAPAWVLRNAFRYRLAYHFARTNRMRAAPAPPPRKPTMTHDPGHDLSRRSALARLSAASLARLAPWALAQKPMTVGFVYVGPKDDFGYNQAHAEAAALVKKMPGIKVVEEENAPETQAVQKTMQGMISQDGATLLFP